MHNYTFSYNTIFKKNHKNGQIFTKSSKTFKIFGACGAKEKKISVYSFGAIRSFQSSVIKNVKKSELSEVTQVQN